MSFVVVKKMRYVFEFVKINVVLIGIVNKCVVM